MSILIWFCVCCFLTAARGVPLSFLHMGTVVVLLRFFMSLTVEHFAEGRVGVKFILLRDWWLIAVKLWLNVGLNMSKCDQNVSISYETMGTGAELTGKYFQNKGTFIVVRSSVFAQSSTQKTHPARDALKRIIAKGETLSSSK
ncbi:hypothetical protein [uncultured Gimesia sp.]|uniref:hypothetical protein n=1 Tax=uncultured Gimesia sp. TaxID=1678688 RepID=UPI002619D796|nr:hypothetical protein [uncultured Gimesia sp.]